MKNRIPRMLLLILFVSALGSLFTQNIFFSLLGLAYLPFLFRLHWTRERPAIFFWAFLYQWMQINAGLIWADFNGLDLSAVIDYPVCTNQAYLLATAGLFAISSGVWVIIRRESSFDIEPLLLRFNARRCIYAYMGFTLMMAVITKLKLPGTAQLIYALGFLKWGLLYITFTVVMKKRLHRGLLYAILAVEFFGSFFSIFAEFKVVLIYVLIFLFSLNRGRFTRIQLVGVTFVTILIINAAILWTAVKPTYREFLAAGEEGQVINVSRSSAMEELINLTTAAFTLETYVETPYKLIKRLSYLDFLSATIQNVPSSIPFENGSVTANAILHILTPRMFFPEKEIIYDSQHLNKYTGRYIADYETTSMSIGYVGDLYIDYGYFAPFAAFFLGMVIGWCYRLIFRSDPNPVWGTIMTVPIFMFSYLFEISLLKLIGNIVTYLLVILVVRSFGLAFFKKSLEDPQQGQWDGYSEIRGPKPIKRRRKIVW